MSIDFKSIKASFPLLETAARYMHLEKSGGEYKGLCPFHDDSNPSFYIYNSGDGFDRYRCFACDAGAEGGDVIDFIAAIENVDKAKACEILTDGKLPEIGKFTKRKTKSQDNLWTPIVPAPDDAPKYNPERTFNPKRGKIVRYSATRVDPYLDADGRLLCYVVRLDFDDEKHSKACITVTYCHGPQDRYLWTAKRMDPPFPMLGLDQLAARPNDVVLLVSGEKCYEYAAKHMPNCVAASWLGGDRTVKNVDFSPLYGRWILFHADNDASSEQSMLTIANLCRQHDNQGG